MIAATAMANDLPLYTCNPKDFTDIERLDVVSVPLPDVLPTRTEPDVKRGTSEGS